jgi:hypothetical protein
MLVGPFKQTCVGGGGGGPPGGGGTIERQNGNDKVFFIPAFTLI